MANGVKDWINKDWFNRFWNGSNEKTFTNAFNKALYSFIGGQGAQYDNKSATYLNKGYKINPVVFSVITQMCDKTKAVPYAVKKVKDQKQYSKIKQLDNATNGNYSIKQMADRAILHVKAYEDIEQAFPLERPNPNQTWGDIIALFKLFLKTTGNFYLYKLSPLSGPNAGVPLAVYVLPSHKIEIVMKKDSGILELENPIDYYRMIDGDQAVRFEVEDVIHVKTANPFIDLNGSHLYGLSPMNALLKNLESSNDGLDNNIKTLKNSGVFGVVSAKEGNFTREQAVQIKQKFIDMDNAHGRLSKLTSMSVPIEFTKLSLNTSELMPFDYLNYDQKQICNVLGWSELLLNSDANMTYNNIKEERKRVVTGNIQPDLKLLSESLTFGLIQKFKGYENSVIEFDITELPEMQDDYKEMVEWMDIAPITPNEKRIALKYETLEIEGMDSIWIDAGKKRIDDVAITESEVNKSWDAYKEH